MNVLVTGAGGFVGSALCRRMLDADHSVTALRRHDSDAMVDGCRPVSVGNIDAGTDWASTLKDVSVLIHLAARVHVMRESAIDALHAYRQVNALGTEKLARVAAESGVRRFIFLSSIKVNGEVTPDQPFSDRSAANPQDPYAVSKWEAEQLLHQISAETGMEVVILRPPLVYGPGVKANFLRLLRWVDRGIPLPLASVDNRRSMIYLGNLVDAMMACIQPPVAIGKTYLVSDGEDVSTPELICRIATAFGEVPHLWPCPDFVLRTVGALAGKASEVARLTDSLQVDGSRFCRELGWTPPYGLDDGLRQTVNWYRDISR